MVTKLIKGFIMARKQKLHSELQDLIEETEKGMLFVGAIITYAYDNVTIREIEAAIIYYKAKKEKQNKLGA